jgi:hypothetical protein
MTNGKLLTRRWTMVKYLLFGMTLRVDRKADYDQYMRLTYIHALDGQTRQPFRIS